MTSPLGIPAAPPNGEERAELASVLASDAFRRSPKLSRLLAYICEKRFRGEQDQVTEYSVALDVLGRPANFDPQVDSVVRVDFYHLRKRLKAFYENGGKDHALEIQVPHGRYAPDFVPRLTGTAPELAPPAPEQAPPIVIPTPADEAAPSSVSRPPALTANRFAQGHKWLAAAGMLLLATGLLAVGWRYGTVRAAVAKTPVISAPDDAGAVRIVAGDRPADYLDKAGRTWLTDRYFNGGHSFHRPHPIARTQDPEIFQSGREGQFAYEIPLKPGVYQLQLYFAETGVQSEGLRDVSLAINGIPHTSLDVASDAGGADTATVKIYRDVSPAKDGLLHLTFQSSSPSFVNAIEVLPGAARKMLPLRFTIRDSVFRDSSGRLWLPDLGYSGGRRSTRQTAIANSPDPELYQVQRFGHFSYSIPVAEGGRYTLKLHFAETWFGLNAEGGQGSRVFDVYCNGTTLLKGFDVLEAGGGAAGRAVVEIFHSLQPSPQGKLDLTFVPVVNYALLSAVEVEEE